MAKPPIRLALDMDGDGALTLDDARAVLTRLPDWASMNGFIAQLESRPGEMARLTEALSAQGVNVLAYAIGAGDQAAIGFVVNDEETTRSTLGNAGITYRELPVLTVRMEDKPGQAASTSRRLADAGVNIEMWLPVDTSQANFTVALCVDNIEAAQEALGEQITEWSYT